MFHRGVSGSSLWSSIQIRDPAVRYTPGASFKEKFISVAGNTVYRSLPINCNLRAPNPGIRTTTAQRLGYSPETSKKHELARNKHPSGRHSNFLICRDNYPNVKGTCLIPIAKIRRLRGGGSRKKSIFQLLSMLFFKLLDSTGSRANGPGKNRRAGGGAS